MANAPDPRQLAAQERAEMARNARSIISVDGVDYTFRLGDVTARDVRDLREHGLTISDVIAGLQGVSQLDRMAAVIWLARRQAGDTSASLAEVEDTIRLDQVISIREEDTPEPVEEFPDPPA